jgi:outer membrane cobalamin receptor
MFGANIYQTVSLFQGNRLTAGIDYTRFGGKAWNSYLDGSPDASLADKTEHELAAYLSLRQSLFGFITLDAGVRLDDHSQAGSEWVPQGGLAFALTSSSELKASISKGFRFPTIRELYMFPPHNPDLRPERIMNYELAYSQRLPNNGLSYGLNLFYLNGDNLIQTLMQDGRPQNINTGTVENWGAEAQIDFRPNQTWQLTANYSWLNMERPVVAAPEHKLYAGADFNKGRWTVGTGIQYIHGLYTSVNPVNKENFMLWNLRCSYGLSKIAALTLKGENLLAQRYEINAGYPMPKATVMAGIRLNINH